jgi:PAS domain S-box-containing protein
LSLFVELAHNIALLFAVTFLYGLIIPRINQFSPKNKMLFQGLVFSLFALLSMFSSIPVGSGFIIDGRSIIVSIATIFAGIIPAVMTAAVLTIYRFILGGTGAFVSLPIVVASLLISLYIFRHQEHFTSFQFIGRLAITGILNASQGLMWLFIIGNSEVGTVLVLPLLVLIPAGTLLLGSLLYYQRQQITIAEALRHSEERYRIVVTSMSEGILMRNMNGEIVTSNAAAEAILGLTAEQIKEAAPTNPAWRSEHEDGSPYSNENSATMIALRTGQVQSGVIMSIHKADGSTTWISINAQPLFNAGDTKPYAVVSTFTDVTEIRAAETNLRQERDLLRTLIDHTPDYIFLKDAAGHFILTNIAHAQAAGIMNPAELIGKTAFDVFSPELAAQFHADDLSIMQSGKPLVNAERETVDAKGLRKSVLTTKIPWLDKDGNVLGLVGISRDVTERKQLEDQTLRLLAEQERVEILQRFLTDMSHDFRTPLSIINSSVYFLRRENINRNLFDEKVNNIEVQSDRMLKLLDDLLEMGQLDQKSVIYNFTQENINPLIQTIVDDFQSVVNLKQQTITFVPDLTISNTRIDALKLSRAIINLVQNAINYTPNGGSISLRTQLKHQMIEFSISDTGLGIAPADFPHIFERFYRADAARSLATGGSGLGLPITKQIVQGHDGTITAQSELGKGTTFVIQLPTMNLVQDNGQLVNDD